MIGEKRIATASVISVHREPDGFNFYIPNVQPGMYKIPAVDAPDKAFEDCEFGFPGESAFRYAERKKTVAGHDYVLVRIREAGTFLYSTDQQKTDEFGRSLFPDIRRFKQMVTPEEMANELERQFGRFGVMAIEHPEATDEDYEEVSAQRERWMFELIQETNRYYKLLGDRQVTPQALRVAHELHVSRKLNPLPEWAMLNPTGRIQLDTFNCKSCGTILPTSVVRCTSCSAIYNWKEAIELGIVRPGDVPPSKLVEAGLVSEDTIPTFAASLTEEQKERLREYLFGEETASERTAVTS